ncbi:hypothetical protein [Anaeromyxobacter diazotrophicus]|uniref:hypothetical protein n=1 Tax=Anaeromyxobacter diazotrophicus TaxID=2590199 RepID=UPI00158FAAF4|nr:hypothetical protein [Anaeromyxobacter diazotrophicus]
MLAVLALAGWVRISNYPAVLGSGELLPQLDGDSYYHLHRALETLRHFPRVPHLDPGMNWPRGAACPWADGFDLGAAAFAAALGGGSPARERLAIALWPVLLGLLAVAATLRLARTVAPGARWRGAVLAAGVAAALVPEGVLHARLGRVDHHVFEALVMTLLATWSLRRLPGAGAGAARPPPSPLRIELEGALVSAVAVYGFTGSPLYVAIAAGPLAWAALRDGRSLGSGGPALLAGGALSAALTVPALLDHGQLLSFKLPTLLQPALVALAGAAILALAWCARAGAGRRRARCWGVAAGAGALAAVAGALAWPAVREVQGALTGWLLHRDPWLDAVGEFQPMFRGLDGAAGWLRAYWFLGWSGFFLPAAAALVAWRLARGSRRALGLLFVTGCVTALSLLQNRFDRVLVPFLAVCVGLAVATLLRLAAARLPWARAPVWAPLALLALYAADPPSRALLLRAPRAPLAAEPFVEAALDLRDRPPPAALAPGVFTSWDSGHQVQAMSGRPVIVNGFGSYLDAAEFSRAEELLRKGEPELEAYLAEHQVGLVLAGAATLGADVTTAGGVRSFAAGRLDERYMVELPLSPLLVAGSGIPGWSVHHLAHLLPRFASTGAVAGMTFRLPFLWSYERVRGAVVRGTAPPRARVVAELPFTEHRRPHVYKAWTDAASDGTFELVLPFPSRYVSGNVRSGDAWTASLEGGRPVRFEVPEAAVRGGATVVVGPVPPPVPSR